MKQYLLAEFTGERVIPGLVEDDLWNEHIARYLFASTLAAGKRVLDVGCGAGYGTHALARTASYAMGFDISPEAIGYARLHYGQAAAFELGDATAFPADGRSFDLIAAFEVIEHLSEWAKLITEAARAVTESGLFMVSTPNKTYYAETRREQGPNEFHEHEFDYQEFLDALSEVFPHVRILAQNQTQAIAFSGAETAPRTEVAFGETSEPVSAAHFYLAVCSLSPIPPLSFVYVPKSGNMLRERENHIASLQSELQQARAEHRRLLDNYRDLEKDFNLRARWAEELDDRIVLLTSDRDLLIDQLHHEEAEVLNRTEWAGRLEADIQDLIGQRDRAVAAANELRVELNAQRAETASDRDSLLERLHREEEEVLNRTEWARRLESHIEDLIAQRDQAISDRDSLLERLHREEAEVRDRTEWAQALERHIDDLILQRDEAATTAEQLRRQLAMVQAQSEQRIRALLQERDHLRRSRWLRLGRRLGVGPRLPDTKS